MTNKERKFVKREVSILTKVLQGVEGDYQISSVVYPCSKKKFLQVKKLIDDINKTSELIKISIEDEENREIRIGYKKSHKDSNERSKG